MGNSGQFQLQLWSWRVQKPWCWDHIVDIVGKCRQMQLVCCHWVRNLDIAG